jgi:hypothetical protein
MLLSKTLFPSPKCGDDKGNLDMRLAFVSVSVESERFKKAATVDNLRFSAPGMLYEAAALTTEPARRRWGDLNNYSNWALQDLNL